VIFITAKYEQVKNNVIWKQFEYLIERKIFVEEHYSLRKCGKYQ